jgi:hypothetical protein
MAVIPHPPYSPWFGTLWLLPISKNEIELKGWRLDSIEEIEAESQSVLNTLTEKDFQEAINWGDGGTSVYMWEGTTLRVMVADRPYGEFYDFYSISLEYFGYQHINQSTIHFHTMQRTYTT